MKFQNHLSVVDCSIECCQENKPQNGEDSYVRALNKVASLSGVCDGCGGSGAKKYSRYLGRTGAYMASRAVTAAAKDWFYEFCDADCSDEHPEKSLKAKIIKYLSICRDEGGEESALKGFMSKDFPTTASIIVAWKSSDDLDILCMWAGDSRCYMLCEDGLHQLTEDDLDVEDAMDNLTADGVLTNVITTSKDFTIHSKRIRLSKPCILFAASDGCFGYYSTPMEFEYVLLDTLQKANSVLVWEQLLKQSLVDVAGDDLSLYGHAFQFGSFRSLKDSFTRRKKYMLDNYISMLKDAKLETKKALWLSYKTEYEKYLRSCKKEESAEIKENKGKASVVSSGGSEINTCSPTAEQTTKARGFRAPTDLD